jgi:hypothetical protein
MEDEEQAQALRELLKREPTPALTNEGQRYVMASSKRVALVDMQKEDVRRSERHVSADAERDANACLIASAPTLLDLLKWLEPRLSYEDRLVVRAAIAKAEGKS